MSSNPQQQAVEIIRQFIVTNVGYDAGHLMTVQAQELTILLPQDEDGSLRSSKPSAAGRVWTHDDLEPAVNSDLNFPAVVDKHGVSWVADERHDGFTGWRTDSHGLVVWRTWFDLAFNRGPLHEVMRDA